MGSLSMSPCCHYFPLNVLRPFATCVTSALGCKLTDGRETPIAPKSGVRTRVYNDCLLT